MQIIGNQIPNDFGQLILYFAKRLSVYSGKDELPGFLNIIPLHHLGCLLTNNRAIDTKRAPKRLRALLVFAFLLHALGFLDLGSLALQGTQVVQLGAANLTAANHFNVIYAGRMNRERALNADAIGHAANGERFADTAITLSHHGAFKRLKTLAATFHNLHENANGVTDAKLGQIGAELSLFDGTNDFTHFIGLLPS
jgi:hypothetical protein